MAQIGNKCPGLSEFHTFESGYCLNQCDHVCIPHSVLVHIQNNVRTDVHQGEHISVTSLLGCLRQLYGERTIDYYREPPQSWWTIRGKILHAILENPGFEAQIDEMRNFVYKLLDAGQGNREDLEQRWIDIEARLIDLVPLLPAHSIPDWKSEVQYKYPIGTINGKQRFLYGIIDVLREAHQEIIDYKTIGDRGLGIIKQGAKQDHIMQFNLYRFLVERGHPVGMSYETYKPVEIKRIRAFYMTMMQVVGTGSTMTETSMWQYKTPDDHPNMVGDPERIAARDKLVLKKGKKKITATVDDYELKEEYKYRTTYAVPDVPLLNLDDIEAFIHNTAPILVEAFENGTMPPMCPPEMREWKCNLCPDQIRNWCDSHNDKVGVKRIERVAEETTIPVEA